MKIKLFFLLLCFSGKCLNKELAKQVVNALAGLAVSDKRPQDSKITLSNFFSAKECFDYRDIANFIVYKNLSIEQKGASFKKLIKKLVISKYFESFSSDGQQNISYLNAKIPLIINEIKNFIEENIKSVLIYYGYEINDELQEKYRVVFIEELNDFKIEEDDFKVDIEYLELEYAKLYKAIKAIEDYKDIDGELRRRHKIADLSFKKIFFSKYVNYLKNNLMVYEDPGMGCDEVQFQIVQNIIEEFTAKYKISSLNIEEMFNDFYEQSCQINTNFEKDPPYRDDSVDDVIKIFFKDLIMLDNEDFSEISEVLENVKSIIEKFEGDHIKIQENLSGYEKELYMIQFHNNQNPKFRENILQALEILIQNL